MALAIDPVQLNWHWYRFHPADGFWSHKFGDFSPVNYDASTKTIEDVATANRGPFTTFCGYFYSVPGMVTLGPVCRCQN
jgi:hypothetical protein